MKRHEKTELAIIGAGPGGYAAAFLAADLGMSVTLVDPEPNPGGVCLFRGCIPSKALLHAAKLLEEGRNAEQWGIVFPKPVVDIDRLRAKTGSVVETLTQGLGLLSRKRKIGYKNGMAQFIDIHRLKVTTNSGQEEVLKFDYAIVASGSSAVSIPTFPSEDARIMDSTAALKLASVPKTLLVVGGGYIGLELGTVYAALGSRVTIVEMLPGLLWGVDRDLVRMLIKKLDSTFSSILTKTKVVNAKAGGSGIHCRLEHEDGEVTEKVFQSVLTAVGRKPNSSDLGIERTPIQVDSQGFIITDQQRRTKAPNIYAIGDVAGQPMLAHKASYEGRVAVEAIAGKKSIFDPRSIPAVVFTDPEIAWCGLTETEAKAQRRSHEIVRFPWAASGRAMTQGRTDGLTKMIIDPESERVLGMGIVGAGAGELIAEGVLAIEMAAVATDVKMTIHPHPTLSETVMEAAELFFGQSTHVYRPKRKS